MSPILAEILIILVLVLANGVFSMSELAIVSARRARLKPRAEGGDRGAAAALDLAADPNRLLPTVQVGITLVGTFAGVYGGATLAKELGARLATVPALAPYDEPLALAVVVAGITFVTLVLGELVPKRLALNNPERIARLVARPLRGLSRAGVPLVRLLGGTTEAVLRLLGVRADAPREGVTEEDVRGLLREGAESGVIEASEHQIVTRVFRLGNREAAELMTPRREVVWIDLADPPEEVRRKLEGTPHSRLPVCDGGLDNVLGIVQVKDLLLHGFQGRPYELRGLLIMPLFVYEGTRAYRVLELFRESGARIALVLDEHGSVEGLITPNDFLEALVGELPSGESRREPLAARRADGSWLLDGRLPLDEAAEHLGLSAFPRSSYRTLAGFVIDRLGHIPAVAEAFDWGGRRFEVVDMDGNRVDRVLVSAIPPPATPG
jgi:putative hemolysin